MSRCIKPPSRAPSKEHKGEMRSSGNEDITEYEIVIRFGFRIQSGIESGNEFRNEFTEHCGTKWHAVCKDLLMYNV